MAEGLARGGMLELPPWLDAAAALMHRVQQRNRAPQSLLVCGPAGTGKRLLAWDIAARRLGLEATQRRELLRSCLSGTDDGYTRHPDFVEVTVEPEKRVIRIEQVQELLEFLYLTSHQGGERVAILRPADALNRSAANCLLKTLEEPPARAVIILVADASAALPATIVSRCQQLRVALPPADMGLGWLEGVEARNDWPLLLDLAGGAPLAALELARADIARHMEGFHSDLQALQRRQISAVSVARSWTGEVALPMILRWLHGATARAAREAALHRSRAGMPVGDPGLLKTAARASNMLLRLREIEDLQRCRDVKLNAELQLSALLSLWEGDAA